MAAIVSLDIQRWLLGGDPAIRWQVRRDLLDEPEGVFQPVKGHVATEGWGAELLSHQDPNGTWAGGLYGPKWTSTTYTLLLLWRMGLAPDNMAARRAVPLLWDGARYFDGALTPAVTIDEPEACVTAMYVTLATYFGYDDPRVDEGLQWLLDNQLEDGGWNCETVRTGSTHSSFHTTISALECLAELVRAGRHDLADPMSRGWEFLLQHGMYKSHRTGEVAHPVFTRLSFPPRWHYDVLRGLDHLQAADAPWDDRCQDAVDLLVSKRRSDGTWPLQHRHAGRVWFDMEKHGGPSRWNTLRALRVLRWASQRRPQNA
ncbi:MAG: prenyltransferase/squalene oxidase repeat-containing protein [Acidimicrobiia bacterium]